MVKVALLLVALLASQIAAAPPAENWDWNRLRFLDVPSPNSKVPEARREQFRKTQVKKVLSKGAPFKGRAKIISIAKHDGEWVIAAEQGFTEDEEIRNRVRAINSERSSGSYSSAALEAGGRTPITRRPLLAWSMSKKPTFGRHDVVAVIGSIVDAKWDDSTITATIKLTLQPEVQ